MNGYEIIHTEKLEEHVTFIRINPTDIGVTLGEIYDSLSDLSWISSFDDDYIQRGFRNRAQSTINYIREHIIREDESSVTSDSGEYIVSELARKTIVDHMGYLDIPLAELIKIKDIRNHGFDFYTKNHNLILLFGESKYLAKRNAYGKALKGIVDFEEVGQDESDIIDIDRFCCQQSKENHANGQKGFVAAFASKATSTPHLIEGIRNNADYQSLLRFNEIICVAVNI